MTLTDIGSAAGGTAAAPGSSRQRGPFHPSVTGAPPAAPRPLVARPVVALGDTAADTLLEAIRLGLAPGDPVAQLLARWPAPRTRPVEVSHTVRGAVPGPGRRPEPA